MGLGGRDSEQDERKLPLSFDELEHWENFEEFRDKARWDYGIGQRKEYLALSEVTKYTDKELEKMGFMDYMILWHSKKQLMEEREDAAKKNQKDN